MALSFPSAHAIQKDSKRVSAGKEKGRELYTPSALIITWLGKIALMTSNIFLPDIPKYVFQSRPDTDLFSLKPVV